MKPKSYNIPLFLLTVILISSMAFGVTFTQESIGQWQSLGFDRYHTNAYNYPTGTISANLPNGTNLTYTATAVAGANFQPLAFDWDSDGDVEIIAPQGTNLKVYDPSTNNLVEEASYSMGASLGNQGWCGTDDTLGKYCVFLIGNNFVSLSYDGSTITSLGSASIPASIDSIDSGVNCFSDSDYPIPYCFAVGRNSTSVDDLHLIQYRADATNDLSFITSSFNPIGVQSSDYSNKYKPIISDIDYDDELEIVFAVDDNDASPDTFIQVYNFTNGTYTVTLDISSRLTSDVDALSFGGFFVYDLDGATDEEVCVFSEHTNADLNLECRDADMTAFDTIKVSSDNADTIAGMGYADIDGDSVGEIVVIYDDNTDSALNVHTYDANSGSFVALETAYNTGIPSSYTDRVPTFARVNNDDNYDMILGDYVIYFNSTGEVESVDQKNFNQKYVVPVEYNKDAIMDFVGQQFNSLGIYSTGVGGLPVSSTITLNTVVADSGFYNYYNTVCKDTTTTFRALECVSGTFDSTCTYVNTDTSAQERIYTTCGGLDNVNGSYSGLNPQVQCNWTTAGTYQVPLYMQDPATASYYGVFDTLTITVVDGTSGVDCNVPTDFISQPSDQTSTTSTVSAIEDEADFFNLFSYGSTKMQLLFGLIIILGMCVMAYATFQSVVMVVIFGVAGLIIVTALGLIPIWIIIGLVVLTALPLLLKLAFGNS